MGRLAQAGPFPFDAMFACRKATEADIPLIRSLAGVAFPATYRELRGGHVFYIASCDGEPCGYVSVERQGERLFHLQKIYVLPRFQGCGAGAFLFRTAVAHVRAMQPEACRMELNVNRGNRALRFYEHMGMRRLREGDFPIGNGFYMNDYIMGLDLG